MIFRVAYVIVITARTTKNVNYTEECPEMNVEIGKFSDDVGMTVE